MIVLNCSICVHVSFSATDIHETKNVEGRRRNVKGELYMTHLLDRVGADLL